MSDDIDSFADLIGLENKESVPESDLNPKVRLPDMIAFLNSIGETKAELIRDQEYPSEVLEKAYPAWQINRGMSMGADTILYANEMNRLYGLPLDAQYRYYINAIPKRKRYNKWHKLEKDADISLVMEHYQCNVSIAKQIMKVIGPEGINSLHNKTRTGGTETSKKRKNTT